MDRDNQGIEIMLNNNTNSIITSFLSKTKIGENYTLANYVLDILEKLPAEDFQELNENGKFSFLDIPIPIGKISSQNSETKTTFSKEILDECSSLLSLINKENTNVEYPYGLFGKDDQFTGFEKMYDEKNVEELGKQSVQYDNQWINNYVNDQTNDNSNLALMHTHPSSLGKGHDTLFNKHKDIMKQFGVEDDGLNISLADINQQIYMNNAIKASGKNIKFESVILMHDGRLVSFDSENGLQLTNLLTIEKSKTNEDSQELDGVSLNEFGEIERTGQSFETNENLDIPTFEPPKVEPVPLSEIRPVQEQLFPKEYGKVEKTTYIKSQSLEQGKELTKEA